MSNPTITVQSMYEEDESGPDAVITDQVVVVELFTVSREEDMKPRTAVL